MKKVLLISAFVLLFTGCLGVSSNPYMIVEAHPGYSYAYPTTKVVVYDYVYDDHSNMWIRVNNYVDYINCHDAPILLTELGTSRFYFTIEGPRHCPDEISYTVYHNDSYITGHAYIMWNNHHHGFHHSYAKVGFHGHYNFNNRHRYATFAHRHHKHKHKVHKHSSNKHKVYKNNSNKRNNRKYKSNKHNGSAKKKYSKKKKKYSKKKSSRRGKKTFRSSRPHRRSHR